MSWNTSNHPAATAPGTTLIKGACPPCLALAAASLISAVDGAAEPLGGGDVTTT